MRLADVHRRGRPPGSVVRCRGQLLRFTSLRRRATARSPLATPGSSSLASEVQAQASRLRERLAQAPAPDLDPRNPFSFAAPRARPAGQRVVQGRRG